MGTDTRGSGVHGFFRPSGLGLEAQVYPPFPARADSVWSFVLFYGLLGRAAGKIGGIWERYRGFMIELGPTKERGADLYES